MKKVQTQTATATILSITKKSDVFALKVSADLFTENSVTEQAAFLLYSEMVMAGAGQYSREGLTDAVKLLGGHLSVSLSSGEATFELSGLAKNQTKLHKLLQLVITEPTFRASELTRAKKLIGSKLELAKESAKNRAYAELKNTLYSKDSRYYTHDIDTLIAAVGSTKGATLKKLHGRFRNTFWKVSVAGSLTTKPLAAGTLALQQSATHNPQTAEAPVHTRATTHAINIPSKQNIEFSIGGALTVSKADATYPALTLGLGVLGLWGGFSGRLMSTVREKEGLTYGIYTQIAEASFNEAGHWRIMTFFSPEQTKEGLTSTLREVRSIIEKGITRSELARFKDIYKTRLTLANDSLMGMLDMYHSNMVYGGTIADVDSFMEAIEGLTVAQVNAALRQELNLDTLHISGAGPIDKLPKPLAKLL